MSSLWKKACVSLRLMRRRITLASLLLIVTAVIFGQAISYNNEQYLSSGNQQLIFTEQQDIVPAAARITKLAPAITQQTQAGRMFQTEIRVDGNVISCNAKIGSTVGELLAQQGIGFDKDDSILPAVTSKIQNGDKIVLRRVEYQTQVKNIEIPYDTIEKESSLIPAGTSKIVSPGRPGIQQHTYLARMVDGSPEYERLVDDKIVRQPVAQTVLVGADAPVSPLDFDIELDEYGKPLHYERVLTDQVATGYSAKSGALTASGREAVPGHVAVNPDEIPYGSTLYITTDDGGFVYGCAVAADTGIGLMYDVVDIDLFYDTYIESCLNGRRIVDVYVLSSPEQ